MPTAAAAEANGEQALGNSLELSVVELVSISIPPSKACSETVPIVSKSSSQTCLEPPKPASATRRLVLLSEQYTRLTVTVTSVTLRTALLLAKLINEWL